MSTRYKPKKRESEPVVDDWEAASDSDWAADERGADSKETGKEKAEMATRETTAAQSASLSGTSASATIGRDAWGEDSRVADTHEVRPNGKVLWDEANRSGPQPQPVLMNRSLPPTVLSPRLYSDGDQSAGGGGAAPPPQILRRERAGAGSLGANEKANEKKKSLKEREEEYRKARERIFGVPTPATSGPGQGQNAQGTRGNGNQRKPQATKSKS